MQLDLFYQKLSVKQAVLQVYNSMPTEFNGIDLIKNVRILLNRPNVYDGTVTKMLRVLRYKDNVINYEVLNKQTSKYKKL